MDDGERRLSPSFLDWVNERFASHQNSDAENYYA